MAQRTPEKLAFDAAIDALYPYLPRNYAAAVREDCPGYSSQRLQQVVRKRGTVADWDAYNVLVSVKKGAPVARKPRKAHKSRRPLATA